MKSLIFAITIGLFFIILSPNLSLAQKAATPTQTWNGQLEITNETGVKDIGGVASKVIVWLLAVIAMVAAIVIIYAGILLVFNGGSEARVAQAKITLQWAIIGLVVAIGAFALVSIIQGVFN